MVERLMVSVDKDICNLPCFLHISKSCCHQHPLVGSLYSPHPHMSTVSASPHQPVLRQRPTLVSSEIFSHKHMDSEGSSIITFILATTNNLFQNYYCYSNSPPVCVGGLYLL